PCGCSVDYLPDFFRVDAFFRAGFFWVDAFFRAGFFLVAGFFFRTGFFWVDAFFRTGFFLVAGFFFWAGFFLVDAFFWAGFFLVAGFFFWAVGSSGAFFLLFPVPDFDVFAGDFRPDVEPPGKMLSQPTTKSSLVPVCTV
ncbi:MAG: hypothetical protein ABGZ17_14915, partial [Planctomycetaceae bacterium]